jgi:hypothetical protein
LEAARHTSARTINVVITATYWQIGRRIVEAEQSGEARADYGELLLKRLAADLTSRFGRGFSWRNLYLMRSFYQAYPGILQTASAKSHVVSESPSKRIISSDLAPARIEVAPALARLLPDAQVLSARFPLPWSHYVRLLTVENESARAFYEHEALLGGWTASVLGYPKCPAISHRNVQTLVI